MSRKIICEFIDRDEHGRAVDASRVLSAECYETFRRAAPASDEQALRFYRILTTHVGGTDRRKPFDEDEEAALLRCLRRTSQPWPGFPAHLRLESRFRGKGFHEKQRLAGGGGDGGGGPRKLPRVAEQPAPIFLLPAPSLPSSSSSSSRDEDLGELTARAADFCLQFGVLGIDVWKSVIGIVRFYVLGKLAQVPQPLSMARAAFLCAEFTRIKPAHWAVMVMDFGGGGQGGDGYSRSGGRRIVVQNEQCTKYFGDMTLATDLPDMCVSPHEMQLVVMAIARAFECIGAEYQIRQLSHNVPYYASYWVDPESLLLVCSAMPANEPV